MNVRDFPRVLLGSVLGLCFALFPLPSLATVTIPETHAAYASAKLEVDRALSRMVRTSPGVSVRTTQGLSGLVTGMGDMVLQPGAAIRSRSGVLSPITAGLHYGSSAVKSAARACLRAPVRCNLAGLVAGSGFSLLLDSIDAVVADGSIVATGPGAYSHMTGAFNDVLIGPGSGPYVVSALPVRSTSSTGNPDYPSGYVLARAFSRSIDKLSSGRYLVHYDFCSPTQRYSGVTYNLAGFSQSANGTYRCRYGDADVELLFPPVSDSVLDSAVADDFSPTDDDIPILLPELEVGTPDLINLPTPDPLVLDETIVEVDDGSGSSTVFEERVRIQEYVISDNDTDSPVVEEKVTETRNRYQDGVLVESLTETTVESAQDTDISPAPGAGGSIDIPTDCALYNPFCLWAEWTQESLDGDEPDLSSLLAPDVEPEVYDSGLGAGSCPEPISLNIGFLSRSIEVSYQPFCDYASTVRPIVLVASYLLAAYMLSGVLRHA